MSATARNFAPIAQDILARKAETLPRMDVAFGSYEVCRKLVFHYAVRRMAATSAGAVKLEGGRGMADPITTQVAMLGDKVRAHSGLALVSPKRARLSFAL